MFYAPNRISRSLLGKTKKSLVEKDKVFMSIIYIWKIKMYFTKAKILKSVFLFTLHLLSREMVLISCLPYTVSKHLLNLCMLTFDCFSNQQSIQNIVSWLSMFSLLKRIPIQLRVGNRTFLS